jgi:hypothetical protein
MLSDNMNTKVKFGLKSKAQTNITKASSQNISILPCFLETGANLAFKISVFRKT